MYSLDIVGIIHSIFPAGGGGGGFGPRRKKYDHRPSKVVGRSCRNGIGQHQTSLSHQQNSRVLLQAKLQQEFALRRLFLDGSLQ